MTWLKGAMGWLRADVTAGSELAFTTTTYEWCEACARNVADDPKHELRHQSITHPNRATRRAQARKRVGS